MSPDTEPGMAAGHEDPGEEAESDSRRQNSTIKFPYVALDDVSGIAETMLHTFGGRCSMVQLATALNQKPSSGAFRVKVTAAKMFGVITGRGDSLTLTPLGTALADPAERRQARVTAFLNVPLYEKMYEEATRQGGIVPSTIKALEAMIMHLGVVQGQAETARLAFQRSAKFAGFNEYGSDRLVMPALLDSEPAPVSAPEEAGAENEQIQPAVTLAGKPTILVEVFKRLPDEGEAFPPDARAAWMTLLAASLDVLYPQAAPSDRG